MHFFHRRTLLCLEHHRVRGRKDDRLLKSKYSNFKRSTIGARAGPRAKGPVEIAPRSPEPTMQVRTTRYWYYPTPTRVVGNLGHIINQEMRDIPRIDCILTKA